MKTTSLLLHGAAIWLAISLPPAARAAETPPLKAGFAERDITPEIGMEAPGGYGKSYHQAVHDPCKVRAAVFDDGKQRVALVGIDALAFHREMVQAVRKADPPRNAAFRAEAILIGASHSHSSGPISAWSCPASTTTPRRWSASWPTRNRRASILSTTPWSRSRSWPRSARPMRARAEARCGAGKGIEDKVAFNRRFRMKNGLTFTHPGQGNPDIVEPAGPTDPEVGVIGAWDEKGKLLGCVVNFACHATTSPGGISAN